MLYMVHLMECVCWGKGRGGGFLVNIKNLIPSVTATNRWLGSMAQQPFIITFLLAQCDSNTFENAV